MSIKRDLLKDKLLDSKSYNTIYINLEDEKRVRTEQMEILVDLLCDDRHKGSQTEVFNFLKKEKKAVDLLIRAIGEGKGDKKKLIATCWEAGLDCDRFLPFFTDLVINEDLVNSMEAFTTIENMSGKSDPKDIETSLARAGDAYNKEQNETKKHIIADLIEVLRKWEAA
jgi:hypothetical protein